MQLRMLENRVGSDFIKFRLALDGESMANNGHDDKVISGASVKGERLTA
jgi:hypothetical protein